MTLDDATLVLLLAERIHGTDEAVRQVAKNIVEKLPGGKREALYALISSSSPTQLMKNLAASFD